MKSGAMFAGYDLRNSLLKNKQKETVIKRVGEKQIKGKVHNMNRNFVEK